MLTAVKFAISVLALAGAGLAQDGLTIDNKHKERVSTPEAEKIHSSACSVVQREFGLGTRSIHRSDSFWGRQERGMVCRTRIRLTKWDRHTFAQGVVWLAFEDLMPSQQRLTIAKRAVTWADSTAEIERLAKYWLARHLLLSDC